MTYALRSLVLLHSNYRENSRHLCLLMGMSSASIGKTYLGASWKEHTAMRKKWMCHCTACKQLTTGQHSKTKHDDIVTHSLLTVPNIRNTGKLPGILLVHIDMVVRLSDVVAPGLGLIKDKLGKVLDVVLHERDQMRLNDMPAGYRLFVPEYMAKGI